MRGLTTRNTLHTGSTNDSHPLTRAYLKRHTVQHRWKIFAISDNKISSPNSSAQWPVSRRVVERHRNEASKLRLINHPVCLHNSRQLTKSHGLHCIAHILPRHGQRSHVAQTSRRQLHVFTECTGIPLALVFNIVAVLLGFDFSEFTDPLHGVHLHFQVTHLSVGRMSKHNIQITKKYTCTTA